MCTKKSPNAKKKNLTENNSLAISEKMKFPFFARNEKSPSMEDMQAPHVRRCCADICRVTKPRHAAQAHTTCSDYGHSLKLHKKILLKWSRLSVGVRLVRLLMNA